MKDCQEIPAQVQIKVPSNINQPPFNLLKGFSERPAGNYPMIWNVNKRVVTNKRLIPPIKMMSAIWNS
jgi:hypothetical protein